jgi:hypothetical protein
MRTAWARLGGPDLDERLSRVFLASLAVVSIILAAGESHEAIGAALVGAAVAFALGAAFFDRVIELSPRGMKVREQLKKLDEVAERELEDADPDEKEEVVAEGREILLGRRSEGEPISPDSALKEARISWEYNGFAAEIRFASWLVSRGWTVTEAERSVAVRQPDLVAEKDDRRIAVEVKVGRRPLGVVVVDQLLALAATVEAVAPRRVDAREAMPVLVVRGVRITRAATERAQRAGVSVYEIDDGGEVRHFLGPELG